MKGGEEGERERERNREAQRDRDTESRHRGVAKNPGLLAGFSIFSRSPRSK